MFKAAHLFRAPLERLQSGARFVSPEPQREGSFYGYNPAKLGVTVRVRLKVGCIN